MLLVLQPKAVSVSLMPGSYKIPARTPLGAVSVRYGTPLLILAFTVALGLYTVHRDRRAAEAMVRGNAVSQMVTRMDSLKALLDYAFRTEDPEELAARLSVLAAELGSDEAIVTDPSTLSLASRRSSKVGQWLLAITDVSWNSGVGESLDAVVNRVRVSGVGEVHLTSSGGHVLGFCPIAVGGAEDSLPADARSGVLVIRRDLTEALVSAHRSAEQHTAEMVVMLVAMAAILGVLIHLSVTQRLFAVADAARRLARGDLNSRTALAGRDEVAALGQAFDGMAEQVAQQQRELERRVRERTDDLARNVVELHAEVAARERAQNALTGEKERIQVTLESIGDAVVTVDLNSAIEYLNPAAERIVGWTATDAIGRPFTEVFRIILESNRVAVAGPAVCGLESGPEVELNEPMLLLRGDGEERSVEYSVAPIRDPSGEEVGRVFALRDTTAAREAARQLSYQASHDALTGLWNRRAFERKLAELLGEPANDVTHCVLYLDLDQFKVVNDTCGHPAGDEFLRQYAMALSPLIRRRDMLARLGGDEFGVLLEHCPLDAAVRVAHQLRDALQDFRFAWHEHSFSVTMSVGLVPVIPRCDTVDSVFRSADIACYLAKDKGGNRIHIYEPDDHELAQRHGEMQWVPRIQEAVAADRLILYFQPIVHLSEPSGLHGELLLRLKTPDGELIAPGVFIPAAERYKQMHAIDRWVVASGFRALVRLCRVTPNPCIGINLSGQSISDVQFLEFVEQQAAESGAPLANVCFEITETAAISNLSAAGHFFSALKPRGCQFALDDFGSGLSSFAYLKNLPVDYLKIDGGFVRDMARDPIDHAMVEAIHRVGHVMGLQTIAEFVEDEAIIERLRAIGVDYGQGYGLGKPRALDDLLDELAAVPHSPVSCIQ